jgi:hypothetical protein
MLRSMKTCLTTRTAVPALAILAWLLLPQTAQCFYNSSTGRWLSRDPIKEQGFRIIGSRAIIGAEPSGEGPSLYLFVENTPINQLDFLGLSCRNPCKWAVRHSEGEVAATVCCGGKKYKCLIYTGGKYGASSAKARAIIDACVMAHEQVHVDDPNYRCPKQCLWKHTTWGDWADPDPTTHIAGERAAWSKEIECLRTNKSRCGVDSVCEAQVQQEIDWAVLKLGLDY